MLQNKKSGMSSIKLILLVLRKEIFAIVIYLINTFVLIYFYYLLFNSKEVIYPLSISLFFLIIYIVYKGFEYKNFYEKLHEAKNSPNYKYVLYNKKEVFEIINQVHDTYINRFYNMKYKLDERDKLLTQMVHNMKTSVSVISLVCEKANKELKNNNYIFDILQENKNLQNNLEETLNIFRLDKFSKDYTPEKVNLKELVNESINTKKREFIYKNVFPKVNIDKNYYIYTDKKWSKYMIEQIISNSIKYSYKPNSHVIFSAKVKKDYTVLYIKDNGIGIREQDITRVFDAFFTGSNGRKNNKSSGFGLYMVKLVADELGHKINIQSKVGQGTTVEITYLSKL